MVLLAQGDEEGAGGGLFGLGAGAGVAGQKERRVGLVAEVVTEDAEGPGRVAESASGLLGGLASDEISAEGLVLPLFWQGGFQEKAARVC